jgi:hypothetical protein
MVWVGRPLRSRYACMSIPLVVMGLLFTGFSVLWVSVTSAGFWAAQDLPEPGDGVGSVFGCFPLCGVPFGLIGLGLLAAPWWMQALARGTAYVLTDRRAIILEPSLFRVRQVRSYSPAGLGAMSRVEYGEDFGDLVFEEVRSQGSDGHWSTSRLGFLAIPHVREVEDLIRRTLLNP